MQPTIDTQSRLKLWLWLAKLYFSIRPLSFAWQAGKSVLDGVTPILSSYLSAKFLAAVPAVISHQKDSSEAIKYLIAMAVMGIVLLLIGQIDTLIRTRYGNLVQLKMHELYIEKLYSFSQEQFDDKELTAKLPQAQNALYDLYSFFGNVFWLSSAIFSFVGSMFAIVLVSPIVGLLVAVSIVPTMIVDYKMNKRRHADNLFSEQYDRMAWRSRFSLEDPDQMPEVRIVRAYKHLFKVWRDNSKITFDRYYKTDRHGLKLYAISNVFETTVDLAANLWFLHLAILGSIGFDRFLFVRGLLVNSSSSATRIASTIQIMHRDMLNFESLREVLLIQPTIKDGPVKLRGVSISVEFRDVSFKYPSADNEALSHISFIMKPDSKVALVGENGAGKSTIIKLLLRLYLPSSGTILINGTPIEELDSESYYKRLSTLFQDYTIFPQLTVRENIAIGSTKFEDNEAVEKAAKLVDIHKTITGLKNGYEQRLSSYYEGGAGLSGGQEQRLGIARALLRQSPLLILDEPTSAIDAKAEFKIFNNIYEAHEGKSTLIVSHRFSTVRRADIIYFLDKGKITESGSHADLIKINGSYKEMFDMQAEGYKD